MKVLGINGSAHCDGNTAIMINKAFEEPNAVGIETELVCSLAAVLFSRVRLAGHAAAREIVFTAPIISARYLKS